MSNRKNQNYNGPEFGLLRQTGIFQQLSVEKTWSGSRPTTSMLCNRSRISRPYNQTEKLLNQVANLIAKRTDLRGVNPMVELEAGQDRQNGVDLSGITNETRIAISGCAPGIHSRTFPAR